MGALTRGVLVAGAEEARGGSAVCCAQASGAGEARQPAV